ncbi:hypothetical protein FDUTEX481_05683 [Tolypothrix sp. PCC 7601]|nr:hypothetical protein FDUTEX481_05683 [Tolypothrix sp. PCC 7601]
MIAIRADDHGFKPLFKLIKKWYWQAEKTPSGGYPSGRLNTNSQFRKLDFPRMRKFTFVTEF